MDKIGMDLKGMLTIIIMDSAEALEGLQLLLFTERGLRF
jgi:hypothetical protein